MINQANPSDVAGNSKRPAENPPNFHPFPKTSRRIPAEVNGVLGGQNDIFSGGGNGCIGFSLEISARN